MYQDIQDTIIGMGMAQYFTFKIQPLEIICNLNGNKFIARGRDNAKKMKSVKDPTGVWYEEDIPTEEEFITITSGVRTKKADYLQEIFSINPEVEGNYQDHWFWKRFFKGRWPEKSFTDKTIITIPKIDRVTGQKIFKDVELTYTVHHSTYLDNRWATDEFVAMLLQLKDQNPYYYTIYAQGEWGNKQLGGLFYKSFNVGKNTLNWKYNPDLPLHISFDFNVNPYMSCSVWQIVGGSCYLIDEIAMKSPANRTKDTCREFVRRYNSHQGGLFVYGDPSGKKESTTTEAGHNDYLIIRQELTKFKPTLRILSTQPPVKTRGDFINSCFDGSFPDVRIYIYEGSVYLKNDLLFGKEASDGTKFKEKYKDDNGVQCEKHHHFSDGMDYMICAAFPSEFSKYQHGPGQVNWRVGFQTTSNNRL